MYSRISRENNRSPKSTNQIPEKWWQTGWHGAGTMGLYKDAENQRIAEWLPAVADWPIERTSDPEGYYNCFAYVVGETSQKWQPLSAPLIGFFWPTNVKPGDEGKLQTYL